MSTTDNESSTYAKAFERMAQDPAVVDEPVDTSRLPGPWSITSTVEGCGMEHPFWAPLAVAALAVCVFDPAVYVTVTIDNEYGHTISFNCTVPSVPEILEEREPTYAQYVLVFAWYTETRSMGVEPIKLYLHSIRNIHFA